MQSIRYVDSDEAEACRPGNHLVNPVSVPKVNTCMLSCSFPGDVRSSNFGFMGCPTGVVDARNLACKGLERSEVMGNENSGDIKVPQARIFHAAAKGFILSVAVFLGTSRGIVPKLLANDVPTEDTVRVRATCAERGGRQDASGVCIFGNVSYSDIFSRPPPIINFDTVTVNGSNADGNEPFDPCVDNVSPKAGNPVVLATGTKIEPG